MSNGKLTFQNLSLMSFANLRVNKTPMGVSVGSVGVYLALSTCGNVSSHRDSLNRKDSVMLFRYSRVALDYLSAYRKLTYDNVMTTYIHA